MKNKKGKNCLAWLVMVLLCLLSGCKSDVEVKLTTGLSQGELFRVENKACTTAEAKLFLMNQKNQYDQSYGERIWNVSLGEETFAEHMEEQLKDFLVQLKSMVLMAESRGISLSEEEKNLAAAAAEEYLAGLSEEAAAYLNMTEEKLSALYREYRLAERLVAQVTAGVSGEISDDEARVIEVQQVILYKNKTATQTQGEEASQTESELQQLREKAQTVAEKAAAGDAFANLQEIYSDEETGSIQVSRYDVDSVWEEAVFALGSGEVSGVIETDDAFYVVRCVNNMLIDETLANKETIRERQKAELFYQEYNTFTASLLSQYDETGWEQLSFTDAIPECQINFYEVYDTYFGQE